MIDSRLRATVCTILFFLLSSAGGLAQGGAAGAGAGAGAGGAAAAGGAASGQSSAAGQSAAGRGATGSGAPGQSGSQAQPGSQTQPGAGPNGYAAAAASGTDPRKPPAAKPGALTLSQVLDRARVHNPTLLAAAENLRAIRAQEIQAAVRANPYIGVAASNVTLPASGRDGNPYVYAVQVSRLFERGNKREYRVENARATTAQTDALLQDNTRQIELAVRDAFTTMLIAKEALELSQAQLRDFRHEVEIANDRYKAGDLGKLDFERLDLQLGSFEADEQNSEITVEQTSTQLQTLMGVPVSSGDFDITGPIVPPPLTQNHDQILAESLQRRPDLRAAQSAIVAADAAARLAISNGTSDPTLEGEYDRSGTFNSAGFNINFPIRIFDRNQGNKETTRLEAEAARLTEQATRNQIASDVNQAWSGYSHARILSTRFGDHYLDESADVLSIARYAFDHGGIALIDYLDALRDARTSTSDALNAYSQTWMAIHSLSAAAGIDLAP